MSVHTQKHFKPSNANNYKVFVFLITTLIVLVVNCWGDQEYSETSGVRISNIEQQADPVLLDVRLFAVFVLLNSAGFDDEYRKEGMHPVRIAVREEVGKISSSLAQQIDTYIASHASANWQDYTRYALMLESPPILRPRQLYSAFESVMELQGFDTILREFYTEARINLLWSRHKRYYDEEGEALHKVYNMSLELMWDYARVPLVDRQARVCVVPNLLNSYHRATLFYDTVSDSLYVIRGPVTSEDTHVDIMLVHELLHELLHPVLDREHKIIDNTSLLKTLVYELPTIRNNYEGSYRRVVEESLVRAIEKRLALSFYEEKLVKQALNREYRQGFLLVWHFYELLEDFYEKDSSPLKDIVPILLKRIDIQTEQNRWEHQNSD
ncbi:MAG: DUF4932 domain-containing protein [Candidatus Latescibacteria bacterium]|jgi:hypothetical protein|nr:DUF4932 domain-containing protein [Candidatus Latescibacterota bacterium]